MTPETKKAIKAVAKKFVKALPQVFGRTVLIFGLTAFTNIPLLLLNITNGTLKNLGHPYLNTACAWLSFFCFQLPFVLILTELALEKEAWIKWKVRWKLRNPATHERCVYCREWLTWDTFYKGMLSREYFKPNTTGMALDYVLTCPTCFKSGRSCIRCFKSGEKFLVMFNKKIAISNITYGFTPHQLRFCEECDLDEL